MSVSVIIPNYNYAHYLREAIEGVLNQTYPDIEIIVVDDGSTDGSSEILKSYGDRILLILQNNQGVSAARNNGVMSSHGQYVAFLDADDSWLPKKIEREVEQFSLNPKLGLVHVGVREVDAVGNHIRDRLDGGHGQIADQLLMLATEGILGGGSGFMVPRSVFDEIGGFDTALSTSADWDLFYRISSRYPIGFVPEVLINYRVHGANMHGNIEVMERDMTLAFSKAFGQGATAHSRKVYGNLYQNLSGSYFYAGDYAASLRTALRSLSYRPANILYFIQYPLRRMRAGRKERN
ncbi:MAG TPA: glycosyltransferase [Pyrinomonadaceae bacterium]|nr:glycosyltransferase [Pyrinomonadaceae bacterium]